MFRNYLTVAFRNFKRNKVFTFLNVIGLALGVTCALLVFMLVNLHLGYDTFHEKVDRTYRVVTQLFFDGEMKTPGTPTPTASSLREEIAQVETVGEFFDMEQIMLTVDDSGEKKKYFYEELEGAYTSPDFFEIFDFNWRSGSPTSMDEPNQIILRQKLATELFGTSDPMGKQIRVNNEFDATVAGVLADEPENSDVWRAAYVSFPTFANANPDHETEWGSVSSSHQLYITLPAGTDPALVDAQLEKLVDKYHVEDAGKAPGGGNAWAHSLQPLSDVHFNGDYGGLVNKSLIWALALVGLFLIGTACINFINLATAQALSRSKEVGIRKVVGGNRRQLFSQFMLETGAIVLLAIVLAVALVNPILPSVNELTRSNMTFNLLNDSYLWVFLLTTFIGVTLFSGTYPALVLAGFKPALAVKGKITTQTLGGFNVRRTLVVAQFAISQLLIISVAVMTMQMDFLRNIDYGFNKDAIVVLSLPENESQKLNTLRNQLEAVQGVQRLSFSRSTASSSSQSWSHFNFENREEYEPWQIMRRPADSEYLETYEIELVAGRNLVESDTVREYLVNEEFVKKIGLGSPAEAIGKSLAIWDSPGPIVGVVKNYHQSPANRAGVAPLAIATRSSSYRAANLKISTADVPKTLASIEKIWTETYPEEFYEYEFFDERIEKFYELESILLTLIRTFCGVAILIGCLGLYGLVTFLVARKLKEIGVRKVLGASVGSILGLFGKEFIRLILIAFVIAAPLGYFAMDTFLSDYENAIELSGGIFLGAILVTMLIAAGTVGWHSWQAARMNPAEVLKSE